MVSRIQAPSTPFLVLLLAVLPASLIAQTPPDALGSGGRSARRDLPRFEAALDVVNVSVSVSDAHGQVLTDLGPSDFRIAEDGIPQELTLFSHHRVPLSVALLVDCSGSMTPALPAVKAAASRLARTLGPGDEAEVVSFNQRAAVRQGFTSDQAAVHAAIQQIGADGSTGLYSALYITLKDPAFQARPDEARRRALVVLTDGEDTSSLVTDDQVLDLARQRDATIYAISLRGVRKVASEHAATVDRASYFLKSLARDTGGRAYFPRGLADLDGVYGLIAEELRAQYVIGYVSSNPPAEGSWRRISIQGGRANMVLRHRAGYYAGRATRRVAR